MTKEEKIVYALEQQEPKPPRVFELGGGYYYKCFWLKCDNTVHEYQNYCDRCGQRIDWRDK